MAASDALLADSELGRDNYLDVTFPPVGLPVKGGRASRGTRVPVTDLHAGERATASALFQVLSEEQRRELAAMGREEALRPK